MTELVFKELSALRERCAERIDINANRLIPNQAVLILSRKRPASMGDFNKVL